MKRTTLVAIVAIGMLTTGAYISAQEHPAEHKHIGSHDAGKHQENKLQTTCPTEMGGAINKSLYVDYNGKRIYVCCEMCIEKVNEDPAKYIKKLEEEGVVLDRVPGA